MGSKHKNLDKAAIINEYLAGGISFRTLSQRSGVHYSTLCDWVMAHKGVKATKKAVDKVLSGTEENMSSEVKKLQQELKEERLRTKLLNAIIDIAEQDYAIPIRKKSGTRRS